MLSAKVIPFTAPGSRGYRFASQPDPIIQIGRDAVLLRLRQKIIESSGQPALSLLPEQAHEAIQHEYGRRVWVFCHTLEFYELARIAVSIRRSRPEDKLLRLTGLHDTAAIPQLFDEMFEPVRGVDEMLRVVSGLSRWAMPNTV